MALPDYTTQDAATYKANIDATAAYHDTRIEAVEEGGTLTVDQVSIASGKLSYSSIPTWAKRVTIMVNDVEGTSAGAAHLHLGTTSGLETTGYDYVITLQTDGNVVSNYYGASQTFFYAWSVGSTQSKHGRITLTKTSGNRWEIEGVLGSAAASTAIRNISTGSKTLSGALSQFEISHSADPGQTFDVGSLTVIIE